ncbi:hypothetical protein [Sulfobacillus thermosulfidooxidans]|uniref:hypothetical protein n=1 Tax=Sulfobacillus thermosulfidooxidans TaxID=28034 RepID=UPI0006B53AC3|nr:hypothetical protein [Sulfobacillus thermosulfidooxidans]
MTERLGLYRKARILGILRAVLLETVQKKPLIDKKSVTAQGYQPKLIVANGRHQTLNENREGQNTLSS